MPVEQQQQTLDMTHELQQRLLEHSDKVTAWVEQAAGKGGDFVAEQAPLVAQEIVNLHFWGAAAFLVVWVALGTIGLVAARKLFKFGEKAGASADYNVRQEQGPAVLLSIVIALASIVALSIVGYTQVYAMVEAVFAPRLLILTELAKIVK